MLSDDAKNHSGTAPYDAVLRKVQELEPPFQPTQVIADFQEALAAAIRNVFGSHVTVSGCCFHYAQALIKRLRKLGLRLTRTDTTTRHRSRSGACYLCHCACLSRNQDSANRPISVDGSYTLQSNCFATMNASGSTRRASVLPDCPCVTILRAQTTHSRVST